MAEVVEVNDNNFEEEVLKSQVPVLVDFWAEWCGPCRQLSPIIKELAVEYAGKVKIVKMNTDQSQRVPGAYRIQALPTVMAFNAGQVVDQVVGMRPKPFLKQMIDRLI